MNKSITLIAVLLCVFVSHAQETKITILSEDSNSIVLHYQFGKYDLLETQINGLSTFIPQMNGATPIMEAHSPDLSKVSKSLQFPQGAEVSFEIIAEEFEEIEGISISPSKGNLYRDINPDKVPYEYGTIYSKDQWYPKAQAEFQSEYQIRDLHGRALWVYPFRAFPTESILRVYSELTIKIYFNLEKSINYPSHIDRSFEGIYKEHFINYSTTKYDPVSEEGNMLIISHADFLEAMTPFCNWKTQIGIENEIVDVATIGDAEDIKQYVQEYYDTNDLTFLLLVGDHQQVPAHLISAGYSDNSYAYVAGDDHYPDLFVGRFSAETLSNVETMVDRTIAYELDPELDNSYKMAVGIGSEDGTESTDPSSPITGMGDDNEADWHHQMNIKSDLLAFTYSSVAELYEGGPYEGSLDLAGYPSASDLATLVDNGLGLINYTGHGGPESFVTTGFNNSDIDALNNTNVFPFIFSVACVNGEFMNSTCFAEKWLRATNNEGEPTGAIAAIMSTINQSWNPPMLGQDEMNDILTEQYEDNIRRSFGAISMQGCMKMNDDYGSAGDEMTDTWMIFGDPSVMIRTNKAEYVSATHEEVLPLGSNSLTVSSVNEGAIVALSNQNELIAEGVIEDGQVVLNFDAISEVGLYTLTVTAFNNVPYISSIQSIVLDGPYVIQNELSLSGIGDGIDGQADYGDQLIYSVAFENVGIEMTDELTITASSTSPYLTILSSSFSMDAINTETISWAMDVLTLSISNDVPNESIATIYFEINDASGNTWNTSSQIILSAPVISIDEYTIDDSEGNGNGVMELGESFIIQFPISNIGSSPTGELSTQLSSTCPYLVIEESTLVSSSLEDGVSSSISFSCSLSDETPPSTEIDFLLVISSGAYSFESTYSFTTSECEVGDLDVLLTFTTDEYSSDETSMSLIDSEGFIFEEFAIGELESDYTYELSYCAAPGTVLHFVINDDYGDGINPGGYYSVVVCDQEVVSGGDDYFTELIENFVVSCDQSSIIFGCMDPEAFNYNIDANYDDGSCLEIIEGCTDLEALNFNPLANVDDDSCEYTLSCDAGYNEVFISIQTDEWGSETSWSLVSADEGLIAEVATDTYDNETVYNSAFCIAADEIVTFTIMDAYGDGLTSGDGYFTLSVCGNVLLEGNDFDSQDQVVFLACEAYNVTIDEFDTTSWEIYPNPNNGSEIFLKTNSQSNFTIVNLVGELIYTANLETGVNKIELPQLSSGVYLVKTNTGGLRKMIVY